MSGAEIGEAFARVFTRAGGRFAFGVPGGGSNLDIVGALEAAGGQFVLTHTETAAAIMAAVAGELSGEPAAVVVTRGPGVASAVNGLAQALLDRQPLLLVSDRVSEADRERVSHQRLDHRAVLAEAVKASFALGGDGPADAVTRALAVARNGKPGPVHLDVDPAMAPSAEGVVMSGGGVEHLSAGVRAVARGARRPLLVAGVGVVAQTPAARAATVASVRRLAESTGVPVLTTYRARGVVPDRAPFAAGVATGATIEAPLLSGADLIIGVGLDPVELIPAPWPYRAPVVLLGPWRVRDSTYFGAVTEVVGDLAALVDDLGSELRSDWPSGTGAGHASAARDRILAAAPPVPDGLTPQEVVLVAGELAPPGTIATVDAGAHMLVAVPLWEVTEPLELLVSSGLATMGFALPAAVAASVVHPDRPIVCLTGDGGLGIALAELETLARLRARVVVVVFDDAMLSLIAIKQKPEGQGGERAVCYSPIDFAGVAAACGVRSVRVRGVDGYRTALAEAFRRAGPTVLDVRVDPSAYGAVLAAIRG